MEALKRFGGVEGMAKLLSVNTHAGLDPTLPDGDDASIATHASVYGENKFAEVPPKAFFALVYENMQDPIILLLLAAAIVSTVAVG